MTLTEQRYDEPVAALRCGPSSNARSDADPGVTEPVAPRTTRWRQSGDDLARLKRSRELAADGVNAPGIKRVLALEDELATVLRALESRSVIDQAKGVIIANMSCSSAEAFQVLVDQSQYENRKLRDVAEEVVRLASRSDS